VSLVQWFTPYIGVNHLIQLRFRMLERPTSSRTQLSNPDSSCFERSTTTIGAQRERVHDRTEASHVTWR
jgi:hypothetical protein